VQAERTGERGQTAWSGIDWAAAEAAVRRLQDRIYRAAAAGNGRRVKNLQKLLVRSTSAKRLAVRRMTQQNAGRNTPGVDGVVCRTPESRTRLAAGLSLRDCRPRPVRRVRIPKSDGRTRPLGIPTIRDRALQMLVKMALEPEWETRFETNSYGFRPGRCTMDAIVALHATLAPAGASAWLLDADIAGCFDNLGHEPLLARLPVFTPTIRRWLKAGTVELGTWKPTTTGAPQGGPLSPLLANVALDGMERLFGAEDERGRYVRPSLRRGRNRGVGLIRYADDVRHITWRWIPFAERRGLEDMTLGPAAHLAARAKGNSSMPSKRERPEDAYGPVPQGPRDMVRTALFEPQPPAMQAYIPRHSVSCRGHRDRTAKSSSSEPSTRWAMGDHPIQGGGRGTYVALDTSSIKGMWDRPPRREAQGDGAAVVLRGRESRPHGEGRQVS
jgi:retron-type reverse transcriptase